MKRATSHKQPKGGARGQWHLPFVPELLFVEASSTTLSMLLRDLEYVVFSLFIESIGVTLVNKVT